MKINSPVAKFLNQKPSGKVKGPSTGGSVKNNLTIKVPSTSKAKGPKTGGSVPVKSPMVGKKTY